MTMHYNIELKKKLCYNICINGDSTIKTAEEFNVPLKTLEKWITAFNKNSHYFDKKIESLGCLVPLPIYIAFILSLCPMSKDFIPHSL